LKYYITTFESQKSVQAEIMHRHKSPSCAIINL